MSSAAATNARTDLALRGSIIEVDGMRLSISDNAGPGVPIVCLHAAGHGSRDFEALLGHAAGRRRIVTLDWPGHGRSGSDHRRASASRYAELLSYALARLDLRPVVLLGNSVGGAAAIEVAAAQPRTVAALVLVDSGGLARIHAMSRLFCRAMANVCATNTVASRETERPPEAPKGLCGPLNHRRPGS